MPSSLPEILKKLRSHESDLRERGVLHAAVFGSVARGHNREGSDVDVLIDLDPARSMGLFEYVRLKLYITELIGGRADVVNRKTVKPLLRDSIFQDSIDAF